MRRPLWIVLGLLAVMAIGNLIGQPWLIVPAFLVGAALWKE